MLRKMSPVSSGRSVCARSRVLISALALVIAANGWLSTVAADAHNFVLTGEELPTRASTFDLEPKIAGSFPSSHECAAVASVRWLPHSTLNMVYARGDFTGAERAAFHRAVGSWREALAQTDVGIALVESGETDRDSAPKRLQIVVKRDPFSDAGHYGKIVAYARRDNYVERALILIKGSLHKRDRLRKTLTHEIGHVLGLRDCPQCRSGVTVMNYFSEQAIMGLRVHGGSSKIANRPTAGDISQVSAGYRQSLPPTLENGEDESESTRTITADEGFTLTDKESSHGGDDNIIAPYLKPASERQAATLAIVPYLQPRSETEAYPVASFAFVKTIWKEDASRFSFLGQLSEREANPFTLVLSLKPAQRKEASSFSVPSLLGTLSESKAKPLAIADLKPASTKSPQLVVASEPAREANSPVVGPSAHSEGVLTGTEQAEFNSYLSTLLEREAQTMKELNDYTFRREVRIQTLDNKGRVSGEYHRTSDIVFDDSGGRIERGLVISQSTLRRLEISPEYVEDFSGAQLKGFDLSKHDHYRIEPFMTDTVEGIKMRVYRFTPLDLKTERSAHARMFYGFVWVDQQTGKIVKIKGCALPDDKQRFPLFETQRSLIDGVHLFPTSTIADDYLVFPSHRIHVRMLITYSNYKKFASRVSVTEIEGQ